MTITPPGTSLVPEKIWANPEARTCRPVGDGVWASETLYVRADLVAAPIAGMETSGDERKTVVAWVALMTDLGNTREKEILRKAAAMSRDADKADLLAAALAASEAAYKHVKACMHLAQDRAQAAEDATARAEERADKSIDAEILAHSSRASVEALLQVVERNLTETRAALAASEARADREHARWIAGAEMGLAAEARADAAEAALKAVAERLDAISPDRVSLTVIDELHEIARDAERAANTPSET